VTERARVTYDAVNRMCTIEKRTGTLTIRNVSAEQARALATKYDQAVAKLDARLNPFEFSR
jgi:hypothetical protein